MGTRPNGRSSYVRRVAALAAGALAAGALALSGGPAAATPQPTIGQVRHKLAQLTSQQDQVIQHADQVAQELSSARQQAALIKREASRDRAKFQSMRVQIAQIAQLSYENGSLTSPMTFLTSSDPRSVLAQTSILMHLSSDRSAEIKQFITAARQLAGTEKTAQRAESAVAALEHKLTAQKKSIAAVVAKQKALLATLTAQQAAQQAAAQVGAGGTTTGAYTGPTTTQAEKAVAFAYAQLGKPYVWGATGPNSYDCSGLAQAAWAAAGVSIPRTTYSQWSALPHVPMSNIEPGDLIFFDGEGHVAIYVGGGMIIDAPQPGEYVEKVSLSSPWYASTLDGAARP